LLGRACHIGKFHADNLRETSFANSTLFFMDKFCGLCVFEILDLLPTCAAVGERIFLNSEFKRSRAGWISSCAEGFEKIETTSP
jgi:hypothetical protein